MIVVRIKVNTEINRIQISLKKKKKTVPKTDPCGTPLVIVKNRSEDYCLLLVRQLAGVQAANFQF